MQRHCKAWIARGYFSAQGIGPIYKTDGIMDHFMYRDILKDVMLPYAEEERPLKWTSQQDNDPKHKSKVVKEWFQNNLVEVLPWPAQLRNLNSIENMWEIVISGLWCSVLFVCFFALCSISFLFKFFLDRYHVQRFYNYTNVLTLTYVPFLRL